MDNTFDKIYYPEGELIGGIDESGVSDIAGPLVAACVILPKIDIHRDDLRIFEVNDSKKISEKYRKSHAEVIWQTALGIGIGEVLSHEVDYFGITEATRVAMQRAVRACRSPSGKEILPDFIMMDKSGNIMLPLNIRQVAIPQGDEKSLCIAAASIVAKVFRDDVMLRLHEDFPYYNWISNKGYPCEDHFQGLDKHGIQIGIHRINKWPFRKNPSLAEDCVKWNRRRKKWKENTVKRILQEESGEKLYRAKPPTTK